MTFKKLEQIFIKYTMSEEADTKVITFPQDWDLTEDIKEVYLLIYNPENKTATYELLDLEKQMYYYMAEMGNYMKTFFEKNDYEKMQALLNFFDESPVVNCRDIQSELREEDD